MNPNYNNQIPGSELIKQFFTRTSMLTITIASAMLSALIIFQTVIYTFSGDKISMISSLYYLFDNQHIEIINAVFGSIISLVSILFFISFLSIYLKAKAGDSFYAYYKLCNIYYRYLHYSNSFIRFNLCSEIPKL